MKYYVVFKGYSPGIYSDWEEVKIQTDGFPGAVFKGYPSCEEATDAFRKYSGEEDRNELMRLLCAARPKTSSATHNSNATAIMTFPPDNPEIDPDAWAVDASCLGNPGKMEYRGVNLRTGEVIFQKGPFEDATNNIGEYLALVHAMALMTQKGEYHNIYSDSKTAISWFKKHKVNTKLQTTPRNAKVFELLARASVWVNTHNFPAKVMKWDTERWGEIPADFGRK